MLLTHTTFCVHEEAIASTQLMLSSLGEFVKYYEPGTLSFSFFQETHSPCSFVMIAGFLDAREHKRHVGSMHYRSFMHAIYQCCEESPVSRELTPISTWETEEHWNTQPHHSIR